MDLTTNIDQLFQEEERRLQKKFDYCVAMKHAANIMKLVNRDHTLWQLKEMVRESRKGDMAARIIITLDEGGNPYLTTEVIDHARDESQLPAFLRKQA
jgi:hypothetical protein